MRYGLHFSIVLLIVTCFISLLSSIGMADSADTLWETAKKSKAPSERLSSLLAFTKRYPTDNRTGSAIRQVIQGIPTLTRSAGPDEGLHILQEVEALPAFRLWPSWYFDAVAADAIQPLLPNTGPSIAGAYGGVTITQPVFARALLFPGSAVVSLYLKVLWRIVGQTTPNDYLFTATLQVLGMPALRSIKPVENQIDGESVQGQALREIGRVAEAQGLWQEAYLAYKRYLRANPPRWWESDIAVRLANLAIKAPGPLLDY